MSKRSSSKKTRAKEAPKAPVPDYESRDYKAAMLFAFVGFELWETCYIDNENLDDLQSAVFSMQRAVTLAVTAPPEWHCLLAETLLARYNDLGDICDLENAISALSSLPTLDPEWQWRQLGALGKCLRQRFERFGLVDDIEHCVSLLWRSVASAPIQKPTSQATSLTNLSNALVSRFERTGKPSDLDFAILTIERAIFMISDDNTQKPDLLVGFAGHLFCRFENFRRLYDLEAAIHMCQSAIDMTPDGRLRKPLYLDRLAMLLCCRFKHLAKLDDLENAVVLLQQANDLIPDTHVRKPGLLSNLGNCYKERFDHFQVLTHSRLVRLPPSPPSPHVHDLQRISDFFIHPAGSSFERTEGLCFEDSVPAGSKSQNQWVLWHPESRSDEDIQTAQSRFKQSVLADVKRAVSVYQRALELMPDVKYGKSVLYHNLACSLLYRFTHFGEVKDLEDCISAGRRACELFFDGHDGKAGSLTNLGVFLRKRFYLLRQSGDLKESIASLYRAAKLRPEGHPARIYTLINLSVSLATQFMFDTTQTSFDAIIHCLMSTSDHRPAGDPRARLLSADILIRLCSTYPEFSSTETRLLAHARIVNVVPELVWFGHSLQRRYAESARLSRHITSAVAAAVEYQSLELAVEWLEAGRALIRSQILAMHTPLDDIARHHPALANALRDVLHQLQHLGPTTPSDLPDDLTDNITYSAFDPQSGSTADRRRGLVVYYERVLSAIRLREGFENFLLPKNFSALASSNELANMDGPTVFINVDSCRCDALVLFSSGSIQLVPLPALTKKRADSLRMGALRAQMLRRRAAVPPCDMHCEGFVTVSTRLLGCLWIWIVLPVLQSLNLIRFIPAGERLPHITWCLTGPLAQLPLHAAGLYDPSLQPAPRVSDFIVSSYTPSLSMRPHCDRKVASSTVPRVLILTQPNTPGQSPLPGTIDESQRICAALAPSKCTVLEHKEATVASTQSLVNDYPWVHFACHASQNWDDPTQSAFALYDGPLTLSALMSTTSDKAELAFLSACQTATGDDRIPEESAHLAAGMLAIGFKGVIATMWSIHDADAPVVVEAYYKRLIALRKTGAVGKGETGAAYALHEAVKCLREKVGETSFERWVPFVHFGA